MTSPTWETLDAAYAYEAGVPLIVTEEQRDDPAYRLSRLALRKPVVRWGSQRKERH
jgi:hypothetical protein